MALLDWFPVPGGVVTSPFGPRVAPTAGASTYHQGVDFRAPVGTPVSSALPGTVTFAGAAGSAGNMVIVDHGQGVTTKYMHLASLNVAPGQAVTAGQVIAASGATGNVTGPHLHYEIWANGAAVDPLTYTLPGSSSPVPAGVPAEELLSSSEPGESSAGSWPDFLDSFSLASVFGGAESSAAPADDSAAAGVFGDSALVAAVVVGLVLAGQVLLGGGGD